MAKKKPARGKPVAKTSPAVKSKSAAPIVHAASARTRPAQTKVAATPPVNVALQPYPLKPVKNQLGFKTAELEHYRELLLAKRDLKLARVLKRLAGFDGLIIDDIGYVQQGRT